MKIKLFTSSLLVFFFLLSPFFSDPAYAQRKSKKEKNQKEELNEFKIKERTAAFMDGNKQRFLGNMEEAEENYRKALRADPNHDPSMYELARIYLLQNRPDDAILMAENAASLNTQNVWYRLLLADLYKNTRRFDKLVEIYAGLVQLNPDKLEYRQDLATAYIITGDLRSAIDVYDDIEKITGITEETALKKRSLWIRLEKQNNALKEIEKLSASNPNNIRYLQILAESYVADENFSKALEIYQRIEQLDPDDPYIHISLSDLYRQKGDDDKAFEELKKGFANPDLDVDSKIQVLVAFYSFDQIFNANKDQALQLSGIILEAHPEDIRALSLYGDLLYRSEKYEQALEIINKVLEKDANNYANWEQKMFIENRLSKNDTLIETSRQAIELFPMQPLPYLFSGFANYQKKNYETAARSLERGLKLVVNNDLLLSQFYSTLGDIYNQLKEYEKSDENFDKALRLNPDDAFVLNNYAYYLSLRKTNLEKAKTMSARSNELEPDKPSFMDTYGWVLYQLGEYAQAEDWIKRAIENDQTNSSTLLEHYGDILYKLGNKEEALRYWKKAAAAEGEKSGFLEKKILDKTLYE
jgi:tetratricopeptide (TPR) repeat protein